MLDERRPRVEAGIARDRMVRVRKLKRPCDAGIRADGLQASEGRGIAASGIAQQILGQLVLLFEVRGNARVLIRHGRPPSKSARVRIRG